MSPHSGIDPQGVAQFICLEVTPRIGDGDFSGSLSGGIDFNTEVIVGFFRVSLCGVLFHRSDRACTMFCFFIDGLTPPVHPYGWALGAFDTFNGTFLISSGGHTISITRRAAEMIVPVQRPTRPNLNAESANVFQV